MSTLTQRQKVGAAMHHWHSSSGDPIYAVGSFYYSGQKYPDANVTVAALESVERLIPRAERGEHGWTNRDARELRAIARFIKQDLKGTMIVGRGRRGGTNVLGSEGKSAGQSIGHGFYKISDAEAGRLARGVNRPLPPFGRELRVELKDGALAWMQRTPYRYAKDAPKRGWVWAIYAIKKNGREVALSKGSTKRGYSSGKLPTFRETRERIFFVLGQRGWKQTGASSLKVPHWTSPDGRTRLWFKPQAIWFTVVDTPAIRHDFKDARSTGFDDLRSFDRARVERVIEIYENKGKRAREIAGFSHGRSKKAGHASGQYFTVAIPYVARNATKWHPTEKTGPFSVLTRGSFASREQARVWADKSLDGHPYRIVPIGGHAHGQKKAGRAGGKVGCGCSK